jgi:Heterokaryon incompatibility protein (HET)
MEGFAQVETVRLCEGCESLNLNTFSLSRLGESGAPQSFPTTIFTHNDAHCSLCRLILRQLQKRGLVGNGGISENQGSAIRLEACETAERSSSTGGRDIVRRFDFMTSSTPRIKIARLWPCTYPIPILGQISDDNESLDGPFPSGRVIDSFANLQLFKRWRQLCSAYHGDSCARPPWATSNDDVPPSFRVINVHTNCVEDAPIKPSYFALSYVWGRFAENDLCATSANISSLKKERGLAREELPQTILDVMKLVIELGGKHLWVDRLCILQDDENDKAQQIPCMDSIYSLAELTIIAASGSDAHDGVAGLSIPRYIEQDTCRIGDELALMVIPPENTFSSCTYNQRGWTFQERLLSRRSLIFTEGQAYWSCGSADWSERLILEPSNSRQESEAWKIPRIHMGSYERIPGEYARDFTRRHYNGLPRIYALKDFTNSSDILDAISGILRRCTLTTGDRFYWGHILLPGVFEDSLSWRKTHLEIDKRTALCPIRGRGEKYGVPFPSWSWLTWKTSLKFMLDLVLHALPKACLMPEIEFFHLDVDGKVKRLMAPVAEADCDTVDRSSLLGLSGSWKGEVDFVENAWPTNNCNQFRDSGRLIFWTSHAELSIQAEERARLGCVRFKIMCPTGGERLGYISEVTLASDHSAAWPFVKFDEKALQSFIVISRKYKMEKRQDEQVLVAHPILKVMWIQWKDVRKTVAERISIGEVDERAWIDLERDWRCVILE